MPSLNRVGSRWDFVDFERTHSAAHCKIRIRHYTDVRVHPVVHIAFEVQHHFFVLRLELINQTGPRLRDIEAVSLAREAVHIVQKSIAVFDLNGLPHAGTDDAWKIDASVLIDRYGLSGNRRLGEVSFEPYENIRK